MRDLEQLRAISADVDRLSIYLIEAARFSFFAAETAFNELQNGLCKEDGDTYSVRGALTINRYAWECVDMLYRFGRVMAQIRGLKHKDSAYKELENATQELKQARDYVQHINSQITNVTDEIYPVLGALSWPSPDKQICFTLSLGTIPTQTGFHSLYYDTQDRAYTPDIVLNVDKGSVNLTRCHRAATNAFDYLMKWLEESGKLSHRKVFANMMTIPASSIPSGLGKRRIRAKFTMTDQRKDDSQP